MSTSRFSRICLELVEYVEKQNTPLFIFALFICCIGWFLSTRHVANNQARKEGYSDLDVLKFSWSVALLLGFYLTPFLFPDRVLDFKPIVALIALPLWLRIVSFILPVSIRSSLVIFAVLAALDSLRIAFGGYTIHPE